MAAVLFGAAVVVGCSQTEPYHKNTEQSSHVQIPSSGIQSPVVDGTCTEDITGPKGIHFKLAFVEFGEHGSLQVAEQVIKARDLVRQTPRPLVVTYIHGWHNNAAPNCDDVMRFKRLLAGLSRSPSVTNGGFQVVGVFLGWRGEIIGVSPFKYLTVFSRKEAAERLASNIDCIDTISQITAEARAKGRDKNYTILIGHSFGGLVLERAVAHSIVTSIDHVGAGEVLPGDLIITLNPASDSILTRQLVSSLYTRMEYSEKRKAYVGTSDHSYSFPGHRQVIVAISAENDGATNKFPYAFWPGTATKRWDPVLKPGPAKNRDANTPRSEWEYYLHTPGNEWDLVNFHVQEVQEETGEPPRDFKPEDHNALQYNLKHNHKDNEFYTSAAMDSADEQDISHWKKWQIVRNDWAPYTPYWIIRVPPQIINNHGGIWSENSVAMMAAIYRMNFPLVSGTQKRGPASGGSEPGKQAEPVPFRPPPLPEPSRVQSAPRNVPTVSATPPPQ